MKYAVRINKRLKNVQVYLVTKKIGDRQGFMTKLFTKAFSKKQKETDMTKQLQSGANAK